MSQRLIMPVCCHYVIPEGATRASIPAITNHGIDFDIGLRLVNA